MRFLIIVKATAASEAGAPPEENLTAQIASYHEELSRAGALLDASRLRPSIEGWRIRHDGANPTVIAGPFADDDKLMGGYTLIQARSREEALEWARRFPGLRGEGLSTEIEVRPLDDLAH